MNKKNRPRISVAVIEPLKKAILVNKLDASAARARVPEGVVRVAGVSADPANVFVFFVVVLACGIVFRLIFRRRRRRRRRCGVENGVGRCGDDISVAAFLRRRDRRCNLHLLRRSLWLLVLNGLFDGKRCGVWYTNQRRLGVGERNGLRRLEREGSVLTLIF